MRALLDNTVLSNFALARRADLVEVALRSEAATTQQVVVEFDAGVAQGRVPPTDWGWIPVWMVVGGEDRLTDPTITSCRVLGSAPPLVVHLPLPQ